MVVRMLLASTMVFTYPMEHFIARHIFISIYQRVKGRPQHERPSTRLHVGVTMVNIIPAPPFVIL